MDRILKEVIEKYGIKAQMVKAVEELSELSVEICKLHNGITVDLSPLASEVADVEIMLAQLKMIFDLSGDVERTKVQKLARLKKRLEALEE